MVRKNILQLSIVMCVLLMSTQVAARSTFLVSQFSGKRTSSDIQSWNVRNSEGDAVTTLNGVSIVGGHGSFGAGAQISKHYRQIPDHYKLKVEFVFYGIETWEDETFFLEADGRRVFSITNSCDCNRKTGVCGSELHTRVQKVEVEFAHYRSDLLLKFSSNLDEPALNESWGVSDVQISFVTCEGDCLVVGDELSTENFELTPFSFDPEPNTESTSCNNGKQIVGGPGAFALQQTIARTLADLPPHSEITLHFLIYFFGEFDQEGFRVSVDETGGRNRVSITDPLVSSGEEGSFCSSKGREEIRDVVITLAHTATEATIHFFDETTDPQATWGISDLRIYVNPCRNGKRCKVVTSEIFAADSDLSGWRLPSNDLVPADFSNTCDKKLILGGLTKVSKENLKKKFSGIKPHNEVSISFQFYKFGVWGDTDVVHVLVDGVVRQTISKTKGQDSLACGSQSANTEVENIEITVPHSSSILKVEFVSTLCKEATEHAYGFREFYVQAQQGRGAELVLRELGVSDGEEATGWHMQPENASPITKCGSKTLFGGLSVFTLNQRIFKQYTDLPAHQWVRVVFNVFMINDWRGNGIDVLVDGRRVGHVERHNSKKGIKSPVVCGSNEEVGDEFITSSVTFPHSGKGCTLEFKTCGDDDSNMSWGINFVQIWALSDSADAATDGTTVIDDFNQYEEERVPHDASKPQPKEVKYNPFFAPPSIRRHVRKAKKFIDPEDEVCAEPPADPADDGDAAERERIKNELERQIEETQRQLSAYKGQLKDIHPDHPYVQDTCEPPTIQEKKVVEEIVEEIAKIEEKVEEIQKIPEEERTPEQKQELEDLQVELEVKQEVLKVEEKKYEEKIEKYEEQEAKKPEYKARCTLNQDVIHDLINKIKDTKTRISKRNQLIHALRLQVANSDEEEESVRSIQERIAKNEKSNEVAVAKIAQLEARINQLETVCKPLKQKVVAPQPEDKPAAAVVVAPKKKVKKACSVRVERIEVWQGKLAAIRERMTKRQAGIDQLKQNALKTGANTAAITAKIEKAEANQEKARDKLAQLEVKIESETYRCEPKPVPTPEEKQAVVEQIVEQAAELEELEQIADPPQEVQEKIEELKVEVEELKEKHDEIELAIIEQEIEKEVEVEEKKEEIKEEVKEKQKKLRYIKRTIKRRIAQEKAKKPKTKKEKKAQEKRVKELEQELVKEVQTIEEEIVEKEKEIEKVEEKAAEVNEVKKRVKKTKLKKKVKKLQVYLEKHPDLPQEEVAQIEEEIKKAEVKIEEIIEEPVVPLVTPPEVPKEVVEEVVEELEPEVVEEEDCCAAMNRQIEEIRQRIQKRQAKIAVLRKGLQICTLNKEAIRLKIESLKAANKKALRKLKDIEWLYANFGTCHPEPAEEEPEPLIPEPIPGCKRVNSIDDRYQKKVAQINKLKKIIKENPGKNHQRIERQIARLEKANEQALYIRNQIDCDEQPEAPPAVVVPDEPEQQVVEPAHTPVQKVRDRIARRKNQLRQLREECSVKPSLKKQQKIEHLEEQNEKDFIRLGGLLRQQKLTTGAEGREERDESIREQVDEQNTALTQQQRVERIQARIEQRENQIKLLQNRCLNNSEVDNSVLEEQIVQLEAANEKALQKIAQIQGTSVLLQLTSQL